MGIAMRHMTPSKGNNILDLSNLLDRAEQRLSVTRVPQRRLGGCQSNQCFHDNSPVLVAAVEFFMETFD